MFEFITSISISILTSTAKMPEINVNNLDLTRTGEKVLIVSVKTEDQMGTYVTVRSVVVDRCESMSIMQQREVNDLAYLK